MSKKILAIILGTVTFGATAFGTADAFAQNSPAPFPSFVQQLAQKLGIDQGKVQTAVDDIHKDRQGILQTRFEERLTQAINDGKITEAQKQLILNKFKDLQTDRQTNMEKFKTMTPEQRKQSMIDKKTDLSNWAKTNGVDLSIITKMGKGGMMGHRMMRGGWKHW